MRIISGSARGRKLLSPVGMGTRPTLDRIKEAIFNIIQNRVRDAVVVDMFSGTGSLGLEAASRGAAKCYLIDMGDTTFEMLQSNVDNLKFNDICKCLKGDTYKYMEQFANEGIVFDLIFIDPPYAKDMIPPAIEIISSNSLLSKEGLIVCKIDSSEEIYEGNGIIHLSDSRKYGNTTVLFYKYKGTNN
ncbi:16S rRNA (guanine(966)-N(2))-methyltransferase RsmD [Clostridium estertheticum]|uniref:16S rRNA (Guanine(966)-N(2))-methyltransferase RsmD n=1 Tax=Clostridium estertheticum subsp. estertheticum TaxID=1552 RepID=A0A1J0GHX9_9CLOT|nr:16S rRNA (guanine(966)-N(2))-methyltransferase RsmD [Clostridium estertheticum]APC40961.1 16S rRNA (guanine(966)-N(2))-methyltransferase RsmD [Clostridium estertheticum subsp. estertheticum]MBU3074024.1 16S rRNA (guanine(966)-N(2))-methyltransferase RsmD [Clostridium estertheticum]MBU3164118.1 16S rRNA (guanine(966)-N(2))-methyltransferase RsmD [Clostridium estertheticum]MBU3170054.1 16S rRNA (guanine(966)-N(2))-methyltransferase RsmD [Clostridium estertheticum]MBZ9617171.1 16S rRNA (guanin